MRKGIQSYLVGARAQAAEREERQQIRFRFARTQGKERKGHVMAAVREIESGV